MILEIQSLLKERNTEKVHELIRFARLVLDVTDKNGTSAFMLIAYSDMNEVLDEAVLLKSSFTFHEAIVASRLE